VETVAGAPAPYKSDYQRNHFVNPVKAIEAMTLADTGMTPSQIAPIVNMPESTIDGIIKKHGRWGEIADAPVFKALRVQQQQVMESAYRAGAAKLFARAFDESKLEKASTYQLVIASGIATDKARLLAGESTENVSQIAKVEVSGLADLASSLASIAQAIDKKDK
jgi:hypothetical protein